MSPMFPYILFCCWIVIVAYLESQERLSKLGRLNCLFISISILVVFAWLRQVVPYTDTWNYIAHFEEIGGFFTTGDNSFLDGGFAFLVKFTKIFSNDPSFFLLIYALFEATLLWFIAIKFTKKPNVFLFFFFLLFYLPLFHIVIRQGVASLLLVIFVFSLLEKRYFKAILFACLAFSFHKTSLIFILAASFMKIITNSKYRLTLLLVSVCLFFTIFSFKDMLYYFSLIAGNFYLDYMQNQLSVNYFGYASLSLIILSFLWAIKNEIDQRHDFIFLLVLVGALMQLILMPFGPFIERITEYWLIFLPILFANITHKKYFFGFYGCMFMIIFWYFFN